jgi:hypothetical protein
VTRGEEIQESISRAIYKRSCKISAPENGLDADFQSGYLLGKMQEKKLELHDDKHPITVEWRRRGKPDRTDTPAGKKFSSWKAGYWAGVFAAIPALK